MKTINEAMKKLQEAKRISLKEAEPTKLDDIVKVDPNKKEINESLDTFWENNDIQMIFWKKYFKEK